MPQYSNYYPGVKICKLHKQATGGAVRQSQNTVSRDVANEIISCHHNSLLFYWMASYHKINKRDLVFYANEGYKSIKQCYLTSSFDF